jgi:hypothetical protein
MQRPPAPVAPTAAQIERAYFLARKPHWPDTLEHALAHPLFSRLIRCTARGLALADVHHRPTPKVPALPRRMATPPPAPEPNHPRRRLHAGPAFDPRRMAANDPPEQPDTPDLFTPTATPTDRNP